MLCPGRTSKSKGLNILTYLRLLTGINMVSITLSVSEEIREKMKQFSEINWSAFIRKSIEEKARRLALKEELLSKFKEETESGFIDWTIKLGRKAKEDSAERLKKEGLL